MYRFFAKGAQPLLSAGRKKIGVAFAPLPEPAYSQRVRWRRLVAAAALLCSSCNPNTDLTVRPPPQVHPSFKVAIPAALETGRLPDSVRPLRYSLSLSIDPHGKAFSGEVVIDVELARPTAAIVMHADGLRITKAEVMSGERRVRAQATARAAAGARNEYEELLLVTGSRLPAGEAKVHLTYTGPLDESLRGIYRATEGKEAYVFTQFEPADARRMLPCFDDPIYKVPFDIAVTVPTGNEVFANAPLAKRQPSPDGKRTVFTFATTERLPTYLLALAIGPLEVRKGPAGPVPIRLIATKGKTKLGDMALVTAAEQLAILADYFGHPYPYAKLDLVAVPNFGPGAMENAGLITFREELLLVDERTASATWKQYVAMTMAHELAHQWFGNLVTMEWWDDLWLNEGFASHLEAITVDRWRPAMRAELGALSLHGWVMDFDALASARAVRQPVRSTHQAEEAFDGITYLKGSAVIKMIHSWVGDEKFRQGVRAFVAEHAWGNATASDMFRALSAASGLQVGDVASTFLDQPGVPLVRAELVCQRGKNAAVNLSQQRYRGVVSAGAAASSTDAGTAASGPLWMIPVCVEHGARIKEKGERVCGLLADRSLELELPTTRCPAWVLPNSGYAGYFRYALPAKQLRALSAASQHRSTVERVGFLTNLWALVQAGETPAVELLEILGSMKRERDHHVVAEIVNTLTHLSDALIEDDVRPKFHTLVEALLLPTAKRLGWVGKPRDTEDDKLMRRTVLTALATLTDERWMAREAKRRAKAYLADPSSLDVDTATIALRIAAHRGDVGFEQLVKALKAETDAPRRIALVQALGSLGDPAALRRALGLLKDGTIKSQDAVYFARAAGAWPGTRAVLTDYLRDNLAELTQKVPGFGVARMVATLRRLCDAKARREAELAFKPLVAKIGGSHRRLNEALDNADLCIDLRARQAGAVAEYLNKRRRF